MKIFLRIAVFLAAAIAVVANTSGQKASLRSRFRDGPISTFLRPRRVAVGYTFTMTNRGVSIGNSVVAYRRYDDGTLEYLGAVSTGGHGTLPGLNSQNGLYLLEGNKYLVVCNPGSENFSILRVPDEEEDDKFGTLPTLVGAFPSEGAYPNSVAQSPTDPALIYILNAGADGSIQGFRFDQASENVTHIGGNSLLQQQPDSSIDFASSPTQVGFDPTGRFLVVTILLNTADSALGSEGDGGRILVFGVEEDGSTELLDNYLPPGGGPTGTGPFSFDFNDAGILAVSNAFDESSSSYSLRDDWSLEPRSELVPAGQGGACWNKFVGGYNYVANTGSNSISSYSVDEDGALELVAAISGDASAEDGGLDGPIDIAAPEDGAFLYVLSVFDGSIGSFRVGGLETGGLEFVGSTAEGLYPADLDSIEGVAGIAVV